MKSRLIVLLLLFIPFGVYAQKIKISEIDDFTGEKKVYTSWETIKRGNALNGKDHFEFMFRYENGNKYLHLRWVTNEVISIREDAKLLFKLSDGKNVEVKALKFLIAEKGAGGFADYLGINPIYVGDFIDFSSESYVLKFRIYTSNGYVDIDLKEKDAKKINKSYSLLLNEVNKV